MDPDALADWTALVAELVALPPADPAFVATAQAAIDLDSFFDLVIVHAVAGDDDGVSNNLRWWREPGGPHQPGQGTRDGRWRWLLSDLDAWGRRRAGDLTYDTFTDRMAPTEDAELAQGIPLLFHLLMEDPELRQRFLDRAEHHLDTTFDPGDAAAHLARLSGRLAPEMDRHTARWQLLYHDDWDGEVARLESFVRERPAVHRAQLTRHFGP